MSRRMVIALGLGLATALTAAAEPPPAHFPGSKGSRAGEYAAKYAAWQKREAQRAAMAAPPKFEPFPAGPKGWVIAAPSEPPVFRRAGDPPAKKAKPEEIKADVEKLEAEFTAGMAALEEAVKGLHDDKKAFADVDKTVAAAAKVNGALLARCKAITAAYGTKVEAPLKKLKTALEAAPAAYRELARDRRAKAAALGDRPLLAERDGYLAQAEFADAAALLAEKRFAQLFRATGGGTQSVVSRVTEAMTAVERLARVHEGWAEVFAAWPSTLEDDRVAKALEKLSNLAEDLDRYTQAVSGLTDAVAEKAKASGPALNQTQKEKN